MPPHRESKVELYAAIRRDSRAGLSNREIQRTHHVGGTRSATPWIRRGPSLEVPTRSAHPAWMRSR